MVEVEVLIGIGDIQEEISLSHMMRGLVRMMVDLELTGMTDQEPMMRVAIRTRHQNL